MSISRKIVLSISSHVLLRCAVCRALSCAPPVWCPCCRTASRKQSQYKRAFLPSSVIYLCIVAPIVLVSSSTAWEGMVRHCCCPSSKATMVKEANPWELQGGAYKAWLPPLQRWGQWGFSRLLFSTHCRTLAHTLHIPSCNLSLPVILSSSGILPMLIYG